MTVKITYLLFVVVSTIYLQGVNPQSDDVTSQLAKSFENLSKMGVVRGILTGRYRPQRKSVLEIKCEEHANPNPFTEGYSPFNDLETCFRGVVNITALLERINENRTEDAISMFCPQTSRLEECSNAVANKIRPCLNAVEKDHLDNMLNGEHELFSFLCYNGGERILRFVEERRREVCSYEDQSLVWKCYSFRSEWSGPHYPDVPDEVLKNKIFEDLHVRNMCLEGVALRSCAAGAYRRCGWQFGEDFATSLLDIVMRGSPCRDLVPSGAAGTRGVLTLLAAAAGAALLL